MHSKSFAIHLAFSTESPQFVYNSYLVYHSSRTLWIDKFIMEKERVLIVHLVVFYPDDNQQVF